MKKKNQSAQVYSNPYNFPIYVTDPSFFLYPSASLYFQRGIDQLFASKLSTIDQQTFQTMAPVSNSEKDRLMGKISRFAIDGVLSDNSKYRMTGWQVLSVPQGFSEDSQMISMVCPEAMITESYIIGTTPTSIGTTGTTNQNAPTEEIPVTTQITTSVLGDKTVTTTNVENLMEKDKVLQNILQWLISQKPATKNYELSTVQISDYTQTFEYRLVMIEKNANGY
jgi:hypothetical protein